jgi:hypothetical protein
MNTVSLKFPRFATPAAPVAVVPPVLSRLAAWIASASVKAAPAPKRVPTRAEEAAPVRELAWRVRLTDPGFSADLYAAAARHEGLDNL